jgi:hypothetical protein
MRIEHRLQVVHVAALGQAEPVGDTRPIGWVHRSSLIGVIRLFSFEALEISRGSHPAAFELRVASI